MVESHCLSGLQHAGYRKCLACETQNNPRTELVVSPILGGSSTDRAHCPLDESAQPVQLSERGLAIVSLTTQPIMP